MPGNSRTKTKKVLRDGNVEIGWGKRSCGLLFCASISIVFMHRTRSGFLLAGGLGSSFAKSSVLLRNVVILLIRIQRFDFHGVLWSQGTPEEEDGYIGWQFVFKSSKRKVGCAMLRYDFLNWDLVRGVSCGSPLLGFMKLLFRTISKILCWRGGLAALLQKVRFLLRYDSDGQWMDVGWMSTGNRFLMNGDLNYSSQQRCR